MILEKGGVKIMTRQVKKIDERTEEKILANKILASNLNRYIKLDGISPSILAEKLSKANNTTISYSTVYDWCTAVKYPRIDNIEMLANYFGILKSDLIEDKAETMIPVLKCVPRKASLESGATRYEDITEEDIYDYEPIPKTWLRNGKKYFVFILAKDEMTPMFNIGDYVLFEYKEVFKNGDYCVVKKLKEKENSTLFRRVSKENGKITLTPINYNYNTEVIDESDIQIVGVAKERRTKL